MRIVAQQMGILLGWACFGETIEVWVASHKSTEHNTTHNVLHELMVFLFSVVHYSKDTADNDGDELKSFSEIWQNGKIGRVGSE